MNKFIASPVSAIPEESVMLPATYIDREIIVKLIALNCTHPVVYVYNMELYVSSMDDMKSYKIIYNYN